jgi:hypothetical protein
MIEGRIVIIPFLQGKLNFDGMVTEPDIDAILEKWLERHPEFRDRQFHIIRGKTTLVEDDDSVKSDLVRVTTDFTPDLEGYDPAEDADLYEEFLPDEEESGSPIPRKIWVQQCEAAEGIEADYGTEKALGYLIGEKLLYFLEVAEGKPEWRAEVPHFIAKIKRTFEPWQIAEFFDTPRRLGALGHVADEEGHEMLRSQMEESEKVREDARHLMLFEWARELLVEDEE